MDFNTELVRHFKKEVFRKHKVDITPDNRAVQRLTSACKTLKKNLSAENITESRIELDNFLPGGGDFSASMSIAKFESLCQSLFDKIMDCVKQVLEDAKLTKQNRTEPPHLTDPASTWPPAKPRLGLQS